MGSTEATKTVLIFYGNSSFRSYSLISVALMLVSVEGRGAESGFSFCFTLCPVFCRACRRWFFFETGRRWKVEGGRIGLLIAVEFDCSSLVGEIFSWWDGDRQQGFVRLSGCRL